MYNLIINDNFLNEGYPSVTPSLLNDDIKSINSDINKNFLIEDNNDNNDINLNNIENIDINNLFNHINTIDNFQNLLGSKNQEMTIDINGSNYYNLFSTNSFNKNIGQRNENLNEKNNKIIFRIDKDNKNKGRIKKNSNLKGRHNKFSEDNIIRKIKGRFLEKCRMYINNEYRKYKLKRKHHIKKDDWIQRINPKVSRRIKRDDNLKWLKSKLYEIYSEKVSVKCSLHKPDHNKKAIEKLFKKNKAKDVINILNKSIKEMFYIFCNNIKIEGFETLDDDLKSLKEKLIKDKEYNIDLYLEKYKSVVKRFENIFINKNSRNNK